jgi:hypothetical protein
MYACIPYNSLLTLIIIVTIQLSLKGKQTHSSLVFCILFQAEKSMKRGFNRSCYMEAPLSNVLLPANS